MNISTDFLRRAAINACCLFITWLSAIAAADEGLRVTIFSAKEIITVDQHLPSATSVAVSNGRIIDVGTTAELLKKWQGHAAVLHAQFDDKYIVPGFVEPHIHPLLSALTLTSEILSIEDWQIDGKLYPAANNRKQYLGRLTGIEKELKDATQPLVSWGFHHYFHGKLTRRDLDKISTIRPIVIWHRSAHEFVLNTAAIEAAGISEDTIELLAEGLRKQSNLADGHFWERAAFDYVMPRVLKFLLPNLNKGLELTERYLHEAGVTTAAEPGGVPIFRKQQTAILGDSDTPFRFFFIADGRTLSEKFSGKALLDATEASQTGTGGKTAFLKQQVKLFSDGAIYSQLMQMREDYTDGHHGEWLMDEKTFHSAFATYWDAGYQIHIHQNGDRGLDRVIDALEKNMARNPRNDHRTTIVHFGYSSVSQVKALARLGAIVSANPYYTVALADKYGKLGLGPDRADQVVRLADVIEEGISLSLHSDMPMAPAQPLYLMWSAVNRITFSGRTAEPDLRISAHEALKAVTINAAYLLRLEEEIGSISVGKRADFTLLDKNPLTVPATQIKDIRVVATVSGGRIFPIAR